MPSFCRLLSRVALLFAIFTLTTGNPQSSQDTLQCIEDALTPTSSSSDCYYPIVTASQTIRQLRDKWVVFMGESTLRQLFLQFLGVIESQPFEHVSDQKGQRKIEKRLAGSRFTFYYLEYYANLTHNLSAHPPRLYDGRSPDLLILNDGLHDLLYAPTQLDAAWTTLSQTLQQVQRAFPRVPVMWIPSPQVHDEHLTEHRKDADWFNNASLYQRCVVKQHALYADAHAYRYYYDVFRNVSYDTWNSDGIHSMHRARLEAEGLVRALYHVSHDPATWMRTELTGGQVMTLLFYGLAVVIVLIGQSCGYLFYVPKSKDVIKSSSAELKGLLAAAHEEEEQQADEEMAAAATAVIELGAINTTASTKTKISPMNSSPNNELSLTDVANNQHRRSSVENGEDGKLSPKLATKLSTTKSLKEDEFELRLPPCVQQWSFARVFIHHYIDNQSCYLALSQLAMCLMILFLFDGPTHYFVSPSLKHYNRDFFIFLHLIFLTISYLTFNKNTAKDSDRILSRDQTEEWKGIMQIVFVMYHYFDAAEVYNLIRVFIGAYVWMTGFGNTSFFISKNIYNINRLFGMLFRLNWLVFWTCLLLNQPLMLYYICPLHTFFFLYTYATWGVLYTYNDVKGVKEVKLCVAGLLLCLLFETPEAVFHALWSPLSFVLSLHGTLYEWHFRTTLDHYSTWLGMVFAVYYEPVYKYLTTSLKHRRRTKHIISGVCLCLVWLWYQFVYRHDKFTYNAMHPYTEIVPIFCYIVLRNIYDPLRPYFSRFLAWMGQITLETYIFQYHLYMINDAKTVLTVIPDYPLCNFIIVSIFYVWISRIAFDATNTLRNYFYPTRSKERNLQVFKTTMVYIAVLTVLYIVSYIISLTFSDD
eukprot:CAMPEP_0202711152 /NCGR_PEP_ID=MMETSP1385-20130828/23008_1 /ASSEMBLY_ACC=CAM_ASM_000861 /TAXON_ID=933848 /ORGANISM="Elphidium margaritaceum" /LENGTH=869 /DNA_ID=CAMNT_0049370827 /DNA_START=719 /DNA_END=3328 /DNA_ORIENTATION=+